MAIIYEVTLKQSFFGQPCINRWNYLGTGTPVAIVPAFALLKAMGFVTATSILPSGTIGGILQEFLPTEVQFIQALARTVTTEHPTDFIDSAFPAGVTGAVTGQQPMSPINAYGFRTNRVRTDVARGTKRIVGVNENNADAGGVLTSGAAVEMQTFANAMTAVLNYTSDGESLQFAPIVCSKLEYTTPSGKRAYKYYSTQALQQTHMAQGIVWSPYRTVRSQVSRQYDS